MNPLLLRRIFFPLYHGIKRTGVTRRITELSRNQWLTPNDVIALQTHKLHLLLRHALQNVPFYHKRFNLFGISFSDLDDPVSLLSRIPLLSKADINENHQLMIAKNEHKGQLIANSTSGSTGESLYFFTDRRSAACRRATVIRNQEWLGLRLGDRQATLWGSAFDINKLKNARGRLHRWFNNYIMLSSYDLSPKGLREHVSRLNSFSPKLLTSYPGPLTELSEFMLRHGFRIPSLKAIISSAETLFSWQKEVIESAFLCPVYNRYGCREFGDIAHQCAQRKGLHINADRCLVEIVDDDGYPCAPGTSGDIIVTDLDNYGMPLIRYRIGDRGRLSSDICSCGRGLPLLEEVEGRTLDLIRSHNGQALGGTFWTLLFKSRPGIKAFQIIQTQIEGILIKYIRDQFILNVPLEYFSKKIRDRFGSDFHITFQQVDHIDRTPSGKTRFIVSLLDSDKEYIKNAEASD